MTHWCCMRLLTLLGLCILLPIVSSSASINAFQALETHLYTPMSRRLQSGGSCSDDSSFSIPFILDEPRDCQYFSSASNNPYNETCLEIIDSGLIGNDIGLGPFTSPREYITALQEGCPASCKTEVSVCELPRDEIRERVPRILRSSADRAIAISPLPTLTRCQFLSPSMSPPM